MDDLTQRFWEISNWLTAFSVVQALTFLGLLITSDTFQRIASERRAATAIIAITAVMTIMYGAAIWWLHQMDLQFSQTGSVAGITDALQWITLGKCAIVALANAAIVPTTWGVYRDNRRRKRSLVFARL